MDESLCRVCLDNCEFLLSIQGEQNGLAIAPTLARHFSGVFEPEPRDEDMVCTDCWFKLEEFHQFYTSVEQAQIKFKLHLTNTKTEEKKDPNGGVMEELPPDSQLEMEIEIKEESQEPVEQYIVAEMPANPLLEPEEIPWDARISVDIEEDAKCQASESDGAGNEDSQKQSSTDEDTANTTRKSTRSLKRRHVKEEKSAGKVVVTADKSDKPRASRVRSISANDDEIIKKYIAMNCELCAATTEDFAEMRQHFRDVHGDIKPYVMCCGRKLNKRFLLVQHAHKHENPDIFKCNECNKTFSDKSALRSHKVANHAPASELSYQCDQCDKRFYRRYQLDLHKPSHIPVDERKFPCDQCPDSKPFASELLLSIHVKIRHKKPPNVCHVCAKEIRDNQAYEKHVRLHFEDSGPRVKCPRPNCDRWLKDEDNLKQHLRRHDDEGKGFTCEECGKLCKNRRALRCHLKYVHSNEVFACDVCSKSFKTAIALKQHMPQHTGESLYKCPFCTRTFNSSANMHSHKKWMHPVEWDEWRKTKRGSSQKIISQQATNAEHIELFATVPIK